MEMGACWARHLSALDEPQRDSIDSARTRLADPRLMALTAEQLHGASLIHERVCTSEEQGDGNEALLRSLDDDGEAFKRMMETSTRDEMDALGARDAGLYSFAKLLEPLAQGIADGRLTVPK